jgi:hypothetical protein
VVDFWIKIDFIFLTFLFLGAILLADENEAGFEEFVSFFLSEQSLRHRELCKIIISPIKISVIFKFKIPIPFISINKPYGIIVWNYFRIA